MADKKRQRLDLPFIKRKTDAVTWIYDHRAGVYAVLALALVMATLFVGHRIVVRIPRDTDAILVDMRTVEELRQEAARLQREVSLRQEFAYGGDVSNAVSNLGARESELSRTAVSQIRDLADNTSGKMDANRDAWEAGLSEIAAMGEERERPSQEGGDDARSKGRVLVEFSLLNPTRYSESTPPPGYRCESDGEVVVAIVVNRAGDVVSATVDRSLSTEDACMHSTALEHARRSRFRVDTSAPERQSGTITYTFVRQ